MTFEEVGFELFGLFESICRTWHDALSDISHFRRRSNEESDRRLQGLTARFDLERARAEAETYRERTLEIERVNKTLEHKVRERTVDLEQAQRETVTRLALAAEYRDDNTGQHTYRVGNFAALLAQAIGMPVAEVEALRIAARLHDVGKIGISDLILLKPGKLTPNEYELIKDHTTIGAQILSGGKSPILNTGRTNRHDPSRTLGWQQLPEQAFGR
jgi:putative nucleotidyltransferase with HDIG domain